MSETYHTYIAIARKFPGSFHQEYNLNTDIEEMEGGNNVTLLPYLPTEDVMLTETLGILRDLYEMSRYTVIFKRKTGNTCREAISNNLASSMRALFKSYNMYGRPTVYIKIEGYSYGDEIIMLAKKYFRGFSNRFGLIDKQNSIILSMAVDLASFERDIATLCMILFIFRKIHTMNFLLARPTPMDENGVKVMLKHLIRHYLVEVEDTDSENPAIGLSLFCYHIAYDKPFISGHSDGPVSLAIERVKPHVLMQYIKDYYIPTHGPTETSVELRANWDTGFKSVFDEIVSLMKK